MIIRNHPDCRGMVMDVAVPVTACAALIEAIEKEMAGPATCYISHAGNGNVHLNIAGKKDDPDVWKLIHRKSENLVKTVLPPAWMKRGSHCSTPTES